MSAGERPAGRVLGRYLLYLCALKLEEGLRKGRHVQEGLGQLPRA
jgi:hypothetical protein